MLLTTRRCATLARVAAIASSRRCWSALPRSYGRAPRPTTSRQINYWAGLRPRPTRSLEPQATVRALGATAQRIQLLAAEAEQLQAELAVLVGAAAPWLLEVPGVGP